MNEGLKALLLITIAFFTLLIGGTIINSVLSFVFMETFESIQKSGIWIMHMIFVFAIFLTYTASENDKH